MAKKEKRFIVRDMPNDAIGTATAIFADVQIGGARRPPPDR